MQGYFSKVLKSFVKFQDQCFWNFYPPVYLIGVMANNKETLYGNLKNYPNISIIPGFQIIIIVTPYNSLISTPFIITQSHAYFSERDIVRHTRTSCMDVRIRLFGTPPLIFSSCLTMLPSVWLGEAQKVALLAFAAAAAAIVDRSPEPEAICRSWPAPSVRGRFRIWREVRNLSSLLMASDNERDLSLKEVEGLKSMSLKKHFTAWYNF